MRSTTGSNEIAEGAGRGRRLTTVVAAVSADSALGTLVAAGTVVAAAGSAVVAFVTSTMVT